MGCMFVRLFSVLKIILGLFMVSNITAFYLKITIVCAPIFVLLMSKNILMHVIYDNKN